jgi:hypothetical protein
VPAQEVNAEFKAQYHPEGDGKNLNKTLLQRCADPHHASERMGPWGSANAATPPTGMATVTRTDSGKCLRGYGEAGSLICGWWEWEMV